MTNRALGARLGAVLLCVACWLAGACAPKPNVLVVAMDACRPEKLGCYGFDRPTSAAIDALAADPDAVVFERHYVQANWTKPSTASLFTGLDVDQHRLTRTDYDPSSSWLPYLHPQFETMAESFADAGYDTWALVKIPHLDRIFGFDQGFALYERRPVADGRLARDALAMASTPREAPFFGYVHLLGCHYPYQRRWRSPEYMEAFGTGYPEAERVEAGIDFTTHVIKERILGGRVTLEPSDVEFLNLIYEATLRRFDERAIEPLLQGLRDRGLWDDTLIVLTADHGEELYDHGGYGHGHAMWEEVVHVPLIVKFPRGRRPAALDERWEGLSRAVDLFPSLAAAAGIDAPEGLAGRNLFAGSVPEIAITEVGGGWAVWRGDYKLIVRDGAPPLLFDLSVDPGETTDLADDRPDLVEDLREASVKLRAAHRPPELAPYEWRDESLPAEAVETLKSLGYVD